MASEIVYAEFLIHELSELENDRDAVETSLVISYRLFL